MCESCRKKIDLEKLLDLILQKHIVNNKPNMECFLQLNKIKECLIASCFAFMQIFQLWRYGQYGMHGNIIMYQKLKFNI
jgi:hypothetical protein